MAFQLENVIDAIRRSIPNHHNVPLHEPEFSGREWEYVKSTLDDSWVSSGGAFVNRFEEQLAKTCGVDHAIAVVNGTSALHVALILAGVEPGDEVLVPSLTFVATANAVSFCQAIPHFIDCETGTLGVDPDKLAQYLKKISEQRDGKCINRKTGRTIRVVIPVHVFGHPVRMPELLETAKGFKIKVVEDATESLGSVVNDKPVGGDGLLGVLSFNGNKIITAGGGGAILTNDKMLAQRAIHITTTAKKPHDWAYVHDEIGFNYRLPNINAALGCAQLECLPDMIQRKRQLAKTYRENFSDVKGLEFFSERPGTTVNYWLNAIILDPENAIHRDPLLEALIQAGYYCRPVWTPMHKLPMYLENPKMDLSTTNDIAERLINLPSSPCLAT